MATIGEILVNLRADVAQFRASMEQAKTQIAGVAEVARGAKSLVEAYIGAFSVRALAEFVSRQTEATAAISETAEVLGVGVEAFQSLSFAAKQVGIEQASFDRGIQLLTKNLGILEQTGTGPAKHAFDSLRLSLADIKGLRSEELIELIAKRFVGLKDSATQSAVALELFGRGGGTMVSFLQQGADGIKDFITQARELGIVLDVDTIRAGEESAKELRILSQVISSDLKRSVVDVAPEIAFLARRLENLASGAAISLAAIGNLFSFLNVGLLGLEGRLTAVDKLNYLLAGKGASAELEKLKPPIAGAGDAVDKAAEKQLARFEALRAELQHQIDFQKALVIAYGQSEEAVKRVTDVENVRKEIAKLGNDADQTHIATIQTLATWLQEQSDLEKRIADAHHDAEAANQKLTDQAKKLADSYDGLTSKEREYVKAVEELKAAYVGGNLSQKEFSEGLEGIRQRFAKTADESQLMQTAVENAGRALSSGFIDAITAGKQLSDVFGGLIKDLEKLVLETLVFDPLQKALSNSLASFFPATAGHAASGGLLEGRTMFPMAGGGIGEAGEAGPEAIMPLARDAAGNLGVRGGSGGGVTINIINNSSSAQVSARGRRSQSGFDIEVMVDEITARNIRRGGQTSRAIEQHLGGSRTPISR